MRRRVAALGLALVVAAGCAKSTSVNVHGTAGPKIAHAADVPMPTALLGLDVKMEDVSKTTALAQRAYIDSLVLYGLRADNLLQATFQVSRFNPGTHYTDAKFRQALVAQIGNQTPLTVNVAGQTVYLTAGERQRLAIWFKQQYFFVLATRQDYATPRTLLRQLLAINP